MSLASFFGGTEAPVSEGSTAEVTQLIENFFTRVGLNASQQQFKTSSGSPGWTLMRGSAEVYLFINENKEGAILRVVSPIAYLPKDALMVAFYRKLLDINNNLVNCGLATDKDVVLCVLQRSTKGLGQDELDRILGGLSSAADGIDDELAKEFGCRKYSERPGGS